MIKKFATTAIILTAITSSACFAQEQRDIVQTPVSTFNKENLKLIKNNNLTNDFLRIITFSQAVSSADSLNPANVDYAKKYADANEKFAQGNITNAYKEYKALLAASKDEDFANIGFAYKFANIGLFSLAQEAINNIRDRELYNNQIQLIKSKLFPQVVLSYDDEIMLAQNYTEIYYNNLSFEVARDMSKLPERLKRSDYAHYILSQAYYNTKEYNKAINEINKAISINPENVNYLKYKAQIFCETNRLSDAVKLMNELLSQNIGILDYRNDIEGLNYYTLAKATKDREKSRFYLANYFLKAGDEQRAVKELTQNLNSGKKAANSMTLLAQIYFKQNKLLEATEMYEKAYKIKKNTNTLIGLADTYIFKKDYRNAADLYVKAAKKDKTNAEALIKASLCYKMLDMSDKSVEYANKALEQKNIGANVYYTASKINDIKKIQYLKKTLSTDPMFVDAWLDLAEISLNNNRYDLVQTYLKPVKYLEKENDRFFYLSGMLNKKNGNTELAEADFKKALELNPFNKEASDELHPEL